MRTSHNIVRRQVFVVVLALLLPGALLAEDWPQVIRNLERQSTKREGNHRLATAYNNYALELATAGRFTVAESQLKKALKIDPQNKRVKKNLSVVLLNHALDIMQDRRQSSRGNQAKSLAQQSLRYDPRAAEAYLLIGDIEYDAQELRYAKNAWEKAKRLNPSVAGLESRMEKLKSEIAVEKPFSRVSNLNFDLRFQNQIDRSTAFDLRGALDRARNEVGRDFNYWPRHRIIVLIYSEQGFARVQPGPDWAAGLYDGKIRIPFPSNPAAQATVKATLYHEYTHAVIHDISRGNCPVWLNEGIAEYQEARVREPYIGHLRAAMGKGRLIPLTSLDEAFKSRDGEVARLAYQQSYSLVSYLVQRKLFFRIRRALEALGNDQTVEEAFHNEFRLSIPELEKRWRRWLPEFVK